MTANFNLPINIPQLQNDRLRLVPLEENLTAHATAFVTSTLPHPETYKWLTYGPFHSPPEYIAWYDAHIRNDRAVLLLAVLLKPGAIARKDPVTSETATFEVSNDTFAGICGLIAQPEHATVDLGMMLLERFQRTFVGTHALGLLLRHCLGGTGTGGLGMRRVQWQANASNKASVRAAERMGFHWEGVVRWQQVLPEEKKGGEGAVVEMGGLPRVGWDGTQWDAGRHTAMLSLCWDDWEGGGRERVEALMRR